VQAKGALIALLVAVVAAAVLVIGCGGDDDDDGGEAVPEETAAETTVPEEPVTVRVAFTPGFGTLPVHLAQERGIFEEHGLDVQTTEGLELASWMAAVGRQWDIVMALPPLLFAATCEGAEVRVISNMQYTDEEHPNNLLVTKDPSIQSIADLRGKRIGVPTLTGGSAESTLYLLQQEGISEDEVTLVEVPFPTAGDQMNAGRIDATVSAIPFYTPLEGQGFRLLDDVLLEAGKAASDGALDRVTTAFFVTTADYAEQNPEVIEGFRESLQEAIEFIEANESEARQAVQEWLELPPAIAESAPFPGLATELGVDELEPFLKISRSLGSVKCEPDLEPIVMTEGG
jgi:NitT/TauT family transport system substrate-binding protein